MSDVGPVSPRGLRGWQRLALAALLQVPAVALVLWGQPPWADWVAALWGGSVLIAATDSGWRWTNRVLVVLAALWLLVPLAGVAG